MKPAIFFVAAGLFAVAAVAQVTTVETAGNLKPTHRLGCIGADQVKNVYTPADLLLARKTCYDEGRYEDGFILFRIAGAYAQYDKWRVADITARDAFKAMLVDDSKDDKTIKQIKFVAEKYLTVASTPEKDRLCEAVKRLGPPDYRPDYMIRHGLHAFTGQGGDGLLQDFDGKTVWREVLQYYLLCGAGDVK